jgi:thymidine phosphorylase
VFIGMSNKSNSLGSMSISDIIKKKRDKYELTDHEIGFIVERIISPIKEERIHESQIG